MSALVQIAADIWSIPSRCCSNSIRSGGKPPDVPSPLETRTTPPHVRVDYKDLLPKLQINRGNRTSRSGILGESNGLNL